MIGLKKVFVEENYTDAENVNMCIDFREIFVIFIVCSVEIMCIIRVIIKGWKYTLKHLRAMMLPVEYNKAATNAQELYDSFNSLENSDWYVGPLIEFATKCETITEFGIFQGKTIAAFLTTTPKRIIAYDIDLSFYDPVVFDRVKGETVLNVIRANSLGFESATPTDMVFLDTRHVYEHVKKELQLHTNCVSKFIAIHDTEYPPPEKRQIHYTAYLDKLVKDAVFEFVKLNPQWKIKYQTTEKSGLIVLGK